MKVFRPRIDDVENLSRGKAARKRGTGSRFVCHRLNQQERKCYETAKQNHFLCARGNGYRKERKGSPLWNIFRQRCDALEEVCIMIEKRTDDDRVVIDLSTLRVQDDTPFIHAILVNVLQEKHAHLCNEDGAISMLPTTTNRKRSIMSYWDLVRTKPIWEIDERLIVISCKGIDNRKIAKAVALDVLKECSNVDSNQNITSIVEREDNIANPNIDCLMLPFRNSISHTCDNVLDNDTISKTASIDEADCIDWDDI